jgi:hypothetical protein
MSLRPLASSAVRASATPRNPSSTWPGAPRLRRAGPDSSAAAAHALRWQWLPGPDASGPGPRRSALTGRAPSSANRYSIAISQPGLKRVSDTPALRIQAIPRETPGKLHLLFMLCRSVGTILFCGNSETSQVSRQQPSCTGEYTMHYVRWLFTMPPWVTPPALGLSTWPVANSSRS